MLLDTRRQLQSTQAVRCEIALREAIGKAQKMIEADNVDLMEGPDRFHTSFCWELFEELGKAIPEALRPVFNEVRKVLVGAIFSEEPSMLSDGINGPLPYFEIARRLENQRKEWDDERRGLVAHVAQLREELKAANQRTAQQTAVWDAQRRELLQERSKLLAQVDEMQQDVNAKAEENRQLSEFVRKLTDDEAAHQFNAATPRRHEPPDHTAAAYEPLSCHVSSDSPRTLRKNMTRSQQAPVGAMNAYRARVMEVVANAELFHTNATLAHVELELEKARNEVDRLNQHIADMVPQLTLQYSFCEIERLEKKLAAMDDAYNALMREHAASLGRQNHVQKGTQTVAPST